MISATAFQTCGFLNGNLFKVVRCVSQFYIASSKKQKTKQKTIGAHSDHSSRKNLELLQWQTHDISYIISFYNEIITKSVLKTQIIHFIFQKMFENFS